MKKVVVILPTYNEAENVDSLIPAIFAVAKKLPNYAFHILVVDDYSPDGTAGAVAKLKKTHKHIDLISKKKEGLGAAIVFGIDYALKKLKPDFLMQIDADWSHDPKLIPQFMKHIENGSDFVIGSRYIAGGSIPGNWGLHRKLFSVIGNVWVRFGLGALSPHDWSSGYRLMRSEVAEKVYKGLSKYSGYTFQIAFLHRIKKMGFKISEVPLVFVDRVHGRSKFPAFDYIQNVILYVLNNSTFIKYVVIGGIGFTVQTLVAKVLVEFMVDPGIAVGVGSFVAIVTNFIGNNFWTFSHHRITGLTNYVRKFIHFCGTSAGAFLIQVAVVGIGVRILGTQAWFWLMVFAIVFLVIPYNYFIYNKFIWKTHKPRD